MTSRRVICALLLVLLSLATVSTQQAPKPYRILLTNDDGVRAPGLVALARALASVGEVTIVAPAENQSGKGHSITIGDPIYVDTVTLEGDIEAFSAAATPASCVKVALGALLKDKPDLVVSGINRGYNIGAVPYVSGTVGAAREAALQGIPSIAASMSVEGHPHGADLVRRVAEHVKAHGLPAGVFLNVNIPPGAAEALKGIRVARQSLLSGKERFEEQKSPGGRRYFWSIWEEPTNDSEGTDVWLAEHGYVPVVPMRIGEFDQGAYETLSAVWR
jgi:5'-nucleotidase